MIVILEVQKSERRVLSQKKIYQGKTMMMKKMKKTKKKRKWMITREEQQMK